MPLSFRTPSDCALFSTLFIVSSEQTRPWVLWEFSWCQSSRFLLLLHPNTSSQNMLPFSFWWRKSEKCVLARVAGITSPWEVYTFKLGWGPLSDDSGFFTWQLSRFLRPGPDFLRPTLNSAHGHFHCILKQVTGLPRFQGRGNRCHLLMEKAGNTLQRTRTQEKMKDHGHFCHLPPFSLTLNVQAPDEHINPWLTASLRALKQKRLFNLKKVWVFLEKFPPSIWFISVFSSLRN